MPAQTKKPTSKAKSRPSTRSRTAKVQPKGLLSKWPNFSKTTLLLIAGLVIIAGAIFFFVSRAGTTEYTALQSVKAGNAAGATLPISYNISSLTGTIRYASPTGSTTSACTSADPCTLARAVAQTTTANSTIVLYGGMYRNQANIQISGSGRDGLRIVAYPGQIPEIRGSIEAPTSASSEWVAEGNYRYRAYVPRPLQDGGGVTFSDLTSSNSMTNLNGDGVGRYADQAWIGTTALKQTLNKATLVDGQFYVDRTTNRLYMTANDAAKAGIETSRPGNPTTADRDRLFQIFQLASLSKA